MRTVRVFDAQLSNTPLPFAQARSSFRLSLAVSITSMQYLTSLRNANAHKLLILNIIRMSIAHLKLCSPFRRHPLRCFTVSDEHGGSHRTRDSCKDVTPFWFGTRWPPSEPGMVIRPDSSPLKHTTPVNPTVKDDRTCSIRLRACSTRMTCPTIVHE